MIATLANRFTFDAAHCLPALPDGHKCKRLHGHTYEVEIVCRGHTDDRGFVVDYDEIGAVWSHLKEALDHRYLNEIPGLETPSTENLVAWMFNFIRGFAVLADGRGKGIYDRIWETLDRIRIKESSSTWCEMTKVEWVAFCGPNS